MRASTTPSHSGHILRVFVIILPYVVSDNQPASVRSTPPRPAFRTYYSRSITFFKTLSAARFINSSFSSRRTSYIINRRKRRTKHGQPAKKPRQILEGADCHLGGFLLIPSISPCARARNRRRLFRIRRHRPQHFRARRTPRRPHPRVHNQKPAASASRGSARNLYPFFLVPFYAVFRATQWTFIIPAFIGLFLLPLVTFRVGEQLFDPAIGFFSALLILFSPTILRTYTLMYPASRKYGR